MDKELFRKTEGLLYDYNDLTNKIELLKAEIKEMEEEYQGCSAIQYEEKSGMAPECIQQILGHNDVGLTLRVYARIAQTEVEYSYRKLVS